MLFHADEIRPGHWPWPNFTPRELACRCCHVVYLDPDFMDALQRLRDAAERPLRINSGHRCGVHNARVGGAPFSAHRRLAVDIDLRGHGRVELSRQARAAGFTGFGFYQTFLHLDMGQNRFWFSGNKAKELWAF